MFLKTPRRNPVVYLTGIDATVSEVAGAEEVLVDAATERNGVAAQ